MAIIRRIPGLEAWVEINGIRATEHADPNVTRPAPGSIPTVTCYIESVHGAYFLVVLEVDHTYNWNYCDHNLSTEFLIDGSAHGRGVQVTDRAQTETGPCRCSVGGRKALDNHGQEVLQQFCFSNITVVNEVTSEHYQQDAVLDKDLGTINVSVYRTIEAFDISIDPRMPSAQISDLKVAEKTLEGRAISHGTRSDGVRAEYFQVGEP